MVEQKFGNLVFENINHFIALFILVLFSSVLFFVLSMLRYQNLDILIGLEKVFLVFEGLIGAVIGYYFGHQPVESAEEKAQNEGILKTEAIAELKQR